MPTYDYQCNACGHAFEEFQSITAEPIKVCPVCGKKKVKRLIGAGSGLIFKGSGFYCTDYRDSSYTSAAKKDSPSSSSESSSSSSTSGSESKSTTTDTKPATSSTSGKQK